MIRKLKTRKRIAVFFLGLLSTQTFTPMIANALTSGPSQPETKQFAAAGTSDMVDLFTGDFKYNIPLLDVEGYPVNLNYASGSGMDDEATWVGLGWNLNVGAISRGLRGLPDDASADTVMTDTYIKPKITYGGRGTLRTEIFGNDIGISGSVTVGVFNDNYTGPGAEFGLNAGLKLSMPGDMTFDMGADVMSSTSSGVDFRQNASLSMTISEKYKQATPSNNISLGYNSREGIKNLTLSKSFSNAQVPDDISSTFTFNTPAIYPRAMNEFKSTNNTYTFDAGGVVWGVYLGLGATGYKSVRELSATRSYRPAYGLLYGNRGKSDRRALMDFLREKDNPIVKGMPNLAVPIATPDIFNYSGQAGSGQFRVYTPGSGIFFDGASNDVSTNSTLGGDIGFGAYQHYGVSLYKQDNTNTTGKWTDQNEFAKRGDFREQKPYVFNDETAYFKEMGEKNLANKEFTGQVKEEQVVSVKLSKKSATPNLRTGNVSNPAPLQYEKAGRQARTTAIAYLTAKEAAAASQQPDLPDYPFNQYGSFNPVTCNQLPVAKLPRCYGYRKPAHLSEMTVQAADGRRMVYGLPVYNIKQEEYSFAVPATANPVDNMVTVTGSGGQVNHTAGLDDYFSREVQPGYASSHLLTALLSPDYADLTGDGITNDDHGTAVKFNYSKVNGVYKWRTPYEQNKAFYNRSLYADDLDDKASFVYGEKELWYLHTIESKNMIAYFITDDRQDGLGVNGYLGGQNSTVKQKRLREIRLYAKNNLTTPIKTVVFEYDYSLCPGVPNSLEGGKLTLKKVYFKYASSPKGMHHVYDFKYDEGVAYAHLSADRWGVYKPANANEGDWALKNDEFPYAVQTTGRDEHVGYWQLKEIGLPTGGTIKVDYESDDYAYVQDKRASVMTKILGLIKADGSVTASLRDARGLRVEIPYGKANGEATDWFIREYLDGERNMYAKMYLNISDLPYSDNEAGFDFIPAYMKVKKVTVSGSGTGNVYANVVFEDKKEGDVVMNPITLAAWQKMRTDYSRYAYPGFLNRIQTDKPLQAALAQIKTAYSNMKELRENFYQRANRLNFAHKVQLGKSFARIVKQNGFKKGGGLRVKMVRMSDNWEAMSGETGDNNYGQVYEYKTTIGGAGGAEISSGVAAYEPSIGGDENTMHQPVEYMEDVKGGLSNFFYLEKPFGEALFPAPQVGYSKVTVRRLNGADAKDPDDKTGFDVTEFFTARDFPVIVESQAAPETYEHRSNSSFLFLGAQIVHEKVMSQGYTVITNDMHGQPRAERAFNKAGAEIASTVYEYAASPYNGSSYRLDNKVQVVNALGAIDPQPQVIGREIEVYTDMRQQETKNFGQTHAQGLDLVPGIFSFPMPIPHFPLKINKEYRLFRSASLLKTVQYSGVVKKVVKTIDGSTISAENLLYDELTGQPVLTSGQNEFDDPVYTLSLPAYWMYERMGPAYKSVNMLMRDFATDNAGQPSGMYFGLLTPGDELISVDNGERLWVVSNENNSTAVRYIIDETGRLRKNYRGVLKVCRSGYRNNLGASAASITSLKDPRLNGKLVFLEDKALQDYMVLDAKATLFDERWGMPGCIMPLCPEGYTLAEDGNCYIKATEDTGIPGLCEGLTDASFHSRGAVFYPTVTSTTSSDTLRNAFWGGVPQVDGSTGGRFNEAGVQLCIDKDVRTDVWHGIGSCFTITNTGHYFLGISSTSNVRIYMDNIGTPLKQMNAPGDGTSATKFHVFPITFNTIGAHNIYIESWRPDNTPAPTTVVELYNMDVNSLKTSTAAQILNSIVFSTKWLRDAPKYVQTYIGYNTGVADRRFTCGSNGPNLCGLVPNCGISPGLCIPGYTDLTGTGKCYAYGFPSADTSYNVTMGSRVSQYGQFGAYFYDEGNNLKDTRNNNFWKTCTSSSTSIVVNPVYGQPSGIHQNCGRLNECGIWLGGPRSYYLNKWWEAKSGFYAPRNGVYYLGGAADAKYEVYVDNALVHGNGSTTVNFDRWSVRPIQLSAGYHTVRIKAMTTFGYPQASVGAEIYNNTYQQLLAGNVNTISRVFSTREMMDPKVQTTIYNTPNVPSDRYNFQEQKINQAPGITPYAHAVAKANIVNPYLYGYLGNWRPAESKVVETNRSDKNLFDANAKGVDLRNAGGYKQFRPFWWVHGQQWKHDMTSMEANTDELWVTSSYATRYNAQGADIENKDALGRYSSAQYGFNQSLPVAVASNARSREIFYESFDDYNFNQRCGAYKWCRQDSFAVDFTNNDNGTISAAEAHSGNNSYLLTDRIQLIALTHEQEHKPGIYLGVNEAGEYFKNYVPGLFRGGFSPRPQQSYLVSVWVKTNDPKSSDPGFEMRINGGAAVSFQKKASVEGWKLMEAVVQMPVEGRLVINIDALQQIYMDDLRICPYDAQIKTYTYDDKTMRLMAELDENNYATFYEYDDEGTLIRVKKETERGILTIKESRSAYRKQ